MTFTLTNPCYHSKYLKTVTVILFGQSFGLWPWQVKLSRFYLKLWQSVWLVCRPGLSPNIYCLSTHGEPQGSSQGNARRLGSICRQLFLRLLSSNLSIYQSWPLTFMKMKDRIEFEWSENQGWVLWSWWLWKGFDYHPAYPLSQCPSRYLKLLLLFWDGKHFIIYHKIIWSSRNLGW